MEKYICIRMGLNFGKVNKATVPNYMEKVLNVFSNYTLKSLINQTDKNFTLLIVHGNLLKDIHRTELIYKCKTNNIKILFTDDKKSFFNNLKNKTFISIRLDADDYIHPECIAKISGALIKNFDGNNIVIANPTCGYMKFKNSYKHYVNNNIALCMGMISNMGEHILNFDHTKIDSQLKTKYPNRKRIHVRIEKEKLFIYNREEFSDSFKSHERILKAGKMHSVPAIEVEKNFYVKNNVIPTNELSIDEGISVCIPAYNADRFIEECLDSVENQTYFKTCKNYEIIIGVDGCQKTLDKLNEIKHRYKNLKIIFNNQNKGVYITQNTIISQSKYDIVLIFNADDIMNETMIERASKLFNKYDIIGFKYQNFNNKTKVLNKKIDGGAYSGIICFNKQVWKSLNGFSPWPCGGDTDFRTRAANASFSSHIISAPLFKRRIHDESLTQNKATGYHSETRKKIVKMCVENKKVKVKKIKELVINKDITLIN